MRISEMVELNRQRQDQLEHENQEFFKTLTFYIRRNNKIDKHAGEELLLEILDHMIAIQSEGRTAVKVLGDPFIYANKLIAELPKPTKRERWWSFIAAWNVITWFFLAQALAGFYLDAVGHKIPSQSGLRYVGLVLYLMMGISIVQSVTTTVRIGPEHGKKMVWSNPLIIFVVVDFLVSILRPVRFGHFDPILGPFISISPWMNLVIFVFGFIMSRFMFFRKRTID